MVQVAQFNTTDQAMLAEGMLRSHGIAATVQDSTLASIFPGAGSGAALYVSEDNAEEATQLLKQHGDI